MESLYHSTNRALQEVHRGFLQCERSMGAAPESSLGSHRELQKRVEQILSNCDRLDTLVQKEPVTRRQNAKLRVDQLKQDVRHLQSSLRSLEAKQAARQQQDRNREQLLHMRFTTNAAAAQGNESETAILIDRALEHSNALNRSNRGLDDLLSHGGSILENLREQRNTMKGIQKKMLDVASTLGMSSTVMRLIERRQEGDKYILFGGMLVTCILMYLIVKFLT